MDGIEERAWDIRWSLSWDSISTTSTNILVYMIMREARSGGYSWKMALRLCRVKMSDAAVDWHNDKDTFTLFRLLHKSVVRSLRPSAYKIRQTDRSDP
jgi:hypothetical protein